MKTAILFLAMSLLAAPYSPALDFTLSAPVKHQGLPDGSDGVSVGGGYFVGASDENNTLRLFKADSEDAPKDLLDLNPLLGFPPKNSGEYRECDLEGATRLGDWIYWIGSHGRNKDGKERKERQVLLATSCVGSGAETKLALAGKPFKDLLAAFATTPSLAPFGLGAAAQKTPETEGALNIESICAKGAALLIGFRNPIPQAGALVIPLNNPKEVITTGAKPVFGEPLTLDLGGLGIRDMASWHDQFLVIGGDYHDHGRPSALFLWSGDPKAKPVQLNGQLGDLNPEGIVIHDEGNDQKIQLLSDDGGTYFRSVWVTISGQ